MDSKLALRSSISGCLMLAAGGIVSAGPAPVGDGLQILEERFDVMVLAQGVGAKGLQCSPGGIWGDFVYVADSGGGAIERIDSGGVVTTFATGLFFPVGQCFGPGPANDFGDFLYVTDFGSSLIVRIDSAGTVFPWSTSPMPGACAFDPSGVYSTDLFVAATAFAGPINTHDSLGVPTPFSPVASTYMRFGPGGAWGTGMYSTDQALAGISTVDPAGIPTPFSGGFNTPEGFDWAFGPGFGGDMFASDVGTGEIWRVKSDGTRTLWGTLPGAADLAFCDGALYVVSNLGGCFKVTEQFCDQEATATSISDPTNCGATLTGTAPILGEPATLTIDGSTRFAPGAVIGSLPGGPVLNIEGCDFLIDVTPLTVVGVFTTDIDGDGTLELQTPNDIERCGVEFLLQGIVLGSTGPLSFGELTNALELSLGGF